MTPHLKHPLRVPSVLPGLWVYLRTWTTWGQSPAGFAGYRSHGCSLWQVAAMDVPDHRTPEIGGYIHNLPGLLPVQFRHRGGFAANASAVDDYLFSLGAEVVGQDEWPHDCDGPGARPDRPPLTIDHCSDLHALLKDRGGMYGLGLGEVL